VLFSCSPPPFNLNLSQSAITASKLTFVGQVGPIQSLSASQNTNFAFYPEKNSSGGITLQAGFVTWISQSTQRIAFVVGGQIVGSPQNLGVTTRDPPLPGYLIQSVKSAYNNFAFSYDTSAPYPSQYKYVMMTGNPSANTYSLPAWTDLTGIFSAAPFNMIAGPPSCHVRYVSISPNPNPGYDTAYVLVKDLTNEPEPTQLFQEAAFQISQAGLSAPVQLRAEVSLDSLMPPDGPPLEALYYYDPGTTYGFAEWYDTPSSSWICWKWTGVVAPSQVTGITHRIDALLTTGELFSSEGEVGRVYDQNGNQLSQFSLTDLSFVGEVYVGGAALMLFSQALWYNNALQFNVYSIPSSNVKSLGQ
jgi:hypothetical protein